MTSLHQNTAGKYLVVILTDKSTCYSKFFKNGKS